MLFIRGMGTRSGALAQVAVLTTAAALSCMQTPRVPMRELTALEAKVSDCETAECRLAMYAELSNRGADLLAEIYDADVPCGSFSSQDCPDIHWCLGLAQGSYPGTYDESSDLLWVGEDRTAVHKTKTASELEPSWNGTFSEALHEMAKTERVRPITLNRSAHRWVKEWSQSPLIPARRREVIPVESCTVVYADACERRVGYACVGAEWAHLAGAAGLVPIELSFSEAEPHQTALGNARMLVLD